MCLVVCGVCAWYEAVLHDCGSALLLAVHARPRPAHQTTAATNNKPTPPTNNTITQVVNGCNIYARASPENKLRIVRALQTGPGYEGPMDDDSDSDDGPPPPPPHHHHTAAVDGEQRGSFLSQLGRKNKDAAAAAAVAGAAGAKDASQGPRLPEDEPVVYSRQIVAMTGELGASWPMHMHLNPS
jgi:hypothetical protein